MAKGVDHLPTDILSVLYEKLTAKEICVCCCVCKHWNNTASQFDSLWAKLLFSDLEISPQLAQHCGKSLKKTYIAERSFRFGDPKKVCLKGHTGVVTCFDLNGPRLISGSEDGFVDVWDLDRKRCEIDLRVNVGHPIMCVSSDGPWVVLGLKNGAIQVSNLKNRVDVLDTLTGHKGSVECIQVAHPIVVSGSSDGLIKVWKAEPSNGNECEMTMAGHQGAVSCVRLDEERGRVVSGSTDWTIRIWDLHSGGCLGELRARRGVVHCLELFENDVVSGSSRVASETFAKRERFGMVEIRDWLTGRSTVFLEDNDENAILCLKRNGKTLVGGGWDGRLRFWSLDTGKCFRTLQALPGYVANLDFELGRVVFGSGDDGMIHLWEFC